MYEKYRVSCQNKFVNLMHLVGFIIKETYFVPRTEYNMRPEDQAVNDT